MLVEHAPLLEREFAQHLVADDDSTLVRFMRGAGWSRVYFAQQNMIPREVRSLEAYTRAEAPLLHHQIRLAKAIGPAFDMQQYADSVVARLESPVAVRFEFRRRTELMYRVLRDSLPTQTRSRRIEKLAAGCPRCRPAALSVLADLCAESDDPQTAVGYLRELLANNLASGDWNGACWTSGRLANLLFQLGDRDSAIRILESALQAANAHQIIDQVARIHMFLGDRFANEGRWALAREHLDEVRRLTNEPTLEGQDVRFLYESLQFPMRVGWWDWVEKDLRAAGPSVRRAHRAGSPWSTPYEAGLIEAEALVAAHDGRTDASDRLFARADAIWASTSRKRIPQRGRLLALWARSLVDGGRFHDGASIAQKGLSYCRSTNIPEYTSTNALVLARARLLLGDLNGCDQALETFEKAVQSRDSRPREWIDYQAVRARWCRARGDQAAMFSAIRSGLARMEVEVSAMDATPETYTFLFGENELHELLHEIVVDPDRSLDIERRWRHAVTLVREDSVSGALTSCVDLASSTNTAARPASMSHPPEGEVEIIYHVGSRVIRWTRDHSGTRRDELPVRPRDLERKVARVMEAVGSEPKDRNRVDRSLASSLRELSRLLLPPLAAMNPARPGRARIQADGVLASFPFETLNLSQQDYRPLQADWNVTYTRAISTPGALARTGTILADPAISARFQQLQGGLPSLAGGRAEAESLAAVDPSARRLFGAAATKHALENIWSDSRYLFLSAHSSSGPRIAQSFFIPLAPDSLDPRIDSEFLEVADVLAANLSGCELVVLSGCATGVPVGLASSGTPSLANSFLDAGAGAVIRTLWPVRDDEAAATMIAFIDLWKRRGMTPEAALNEVRRQRMVGPRGYRHPFAWAAYGIELADARGIAPVAIHVAGIPTSSRASRSSARARVP